MKHLGDITKISGYDVPVVDIVTGGSPCQDLSVAGKRAGLAGQRSGLFMEQIRVIKEMRENDRKNGSTNEHIRPRYMVWENVPGAFSSNNGEDFRAVLEETARVSDEEAVIPELEKGEQWTSAGCILGDGWSIAWRVHDAQFWGVPQRRKRISLVADFGGESAPEILFERKGVRRDIEESREEGQDIAENVRHSTTQPSRAISFQERAGKPGGGKGILIQDEHTGALSTLNNQPICYGVDAYNHKISGDVAVTLNATSGDSPTHSGPSVLTFEPGAASRVGGHVYEDNVAGTVRANAGDNQQAVVYRKQGHPQNPEQGQGWEQTDVNNILNAFDNDEGRTPTVVIENKVNAFDNYNISLTGEVAKTLQSEGGGSGVNEGCVLIENHPADSRVKVAEGGIVQTLSGRMGTGGGNVPMVMEPVSFGNGQLHDAMSPTVDIAKTLNCMADPAKVVTYGLDRASYNQGQNAKFGFSIDEEKIGAQVAKGPGAVCTSIVRRLTPMECERLQGFPDGWTDIGDWIDTKGKKHKGDADSPRYKALGNSIALPFWQWMADRMVKALGKDNPTMASLFDGIGGFPLVFSRCGCTPAWASEIEEFPIAVTKKHFPEKV